MLHGVGVCTGGHSRAHEGWVYLTASAGDGHLVSEVVWNSGLGAGLAGVVSHAWSHMMAGRDTGVLHATRMWEVLRHLHACHHLRPSAAWLCTLCLSCALRVACAGSCKREGGRGRAIDGPGPTFFFSQQAQSPTPTPMADGRGVRRVASMRRGLWRRSRRIVGTIAKQRTAARGASDRRVLYRTRTGCGLAGLGPNRTRKDG